LKSTGFFFQTFEDFLKIPQMNVIVLRHDVDLLPYNSLRFAKIQHDHGVKGVYYFRAVPESWDETVIKEIHALGHEVGYHYENLTTCEGSMEKGIKNFEFNLERLRQLVPVSTICMHGSPRSKFDSKDLWNHFKYQDFDIIGEPYFDIDFNKMFYLTDTGRRWDGWKVSVRDKMPQQAEWVKKGFVFQSTKDIIKAALEGRLPNQMMMTFHPQRWNDKSLPWFKELISQNIKNQVKKILIKKRRDRA
jgi:hypothetical protein